MTPNSKPIEKSAPTSSPRPINSPEFLRETLEEIRDMAEKGHIKVNQFEFHPPKK